MFLLMAFVFGFGMAATVLIGQAFGRRDVDGARRVIGTAMASSSFVAVAIGDRSAGSSRRRCSSCSRRPPGAAPLALAYLRVIFLAMPAILLIVLLMMALRGAGDAMTPLWLMILAVVLDSGLNPVFILGLGPAPSSASPVRRPRR